MKGKNPGIANWRPSFRMALVLYVVAPLGLALGLTGYFAMKQWEHQVESRMQSDLEMVARAIQLPLSHAMERNRQGGIEQTLVNLLRNAIQAPTTRTVRLEWDIKDKAMVFAVDDNGPGIPEAIRPRLFEPFFTTKAVGQGTGLGLAVVHGIIREHGGSVCVGESERGGTRIEVSLPIKPTSDRDIPA